jgi:hypothetical protein
MDVSSFVGKLLEEGFAQDAPEPAGRGRLAAELPPGVGENTRRTSRSECTASECL